MTSVINKFMEAWPEFGPAAICRLDRKYLDSLDSSRGQARGMACSCVTVVLGTSLYGFVFGVWHSFEQAVYSACKMPLLFFSIILSSAVINTMLAQVFGSGLKLRQVCTAMLTGMAISAIILGALSPVMLFMIVQVPFAAAREVSMSMETYWVVLLAHVAAVGLSGLVGNIKLFVLLKAISGSRQMAVRLLVSWLLVCGFVGCELSWMLSPFLCKPDQPAHVFPREYFEQNFYERVWYAVKEAF